MIITCPNCHTRYQLAENAIGSAGRKVSCAQCQESWKALPEPDPPKQNPKPKLVTSTPNEDKLFDAADEAALDAEFERAAREQSEAKGSDSFSREKDDGSEDGSDDSEPVAECDAPAKAKEKGLDAVLKSKRLRAMQQRQAALRKKLPMGRIQSNARFALIVIFALMLGGGLFLRNEIVRVVPDLAGVYAVVGMPVNVVGLEFENVETLRSLQNGADVMLVTGQVRNIRRGQVSVPSIVVSILDSDGASLYSWSVTPLSRVLGPREKLDFEARLNSAPDNAASVKLAFAEDG